MYSKSMTSALLALAASGLVSAQTFTDCNPMEKTCDPDPAFGKNSVDCDLTSECDAFTALPGTTVTYDSNGALFTIEKESNAPTMATKKRIFFGSVEVELQAAAGQGIVTSVVLESADLDEIDWEWVGADTTHVQSNYYGKGDTTTYDRAEYHEMGNPFTSAHTYKIDWTSSRIEWSIDGSVVRTLSYADAKSGTRYPQTPMEVKIGTWVGGGKNSAEGTVEWAGGYTDFDDAPFNAYYKSIKIVDYAGGDSATSESVKEYVWTDKTGSYESIKVVKGSSSSDDEDTTTTKTSSSTKSHSATKTTDETETKTSEEATTTKESESSKTKTHESTTKEATTTKESSTASSTPDSTTTIKTPSASSTSEETSSASATSTPSSVPADGAAAGILASFGRVLAAGGAAVAVAQLL